jgi:hypothetical protein
MKLKYFYFLPVFVAILQFVSCTTLLEMAEPKEAKPTGSSFIELKDGKVISGKTIGYPPPPQFDLSEIDFFKRKVRDDDWIAIDEQKIPVASIYGYQDKGLYRALYKDRVLERLEKGRLNLYSFERDVQGLGGQNLYKETVYVYEKERGQFKAIDDRLDLFYEAITDNANAANLCKELFPYLSFSKMSSSGEKLRRVVGVYNQ